MRSGTFSTSSPFAEYGRACLVNEGASLLWVYETESLVKQRRIVAVCALGERCRGPLSTFGNRTFCDGAVFNHQHSERPILIRHYWRRAFSARPASKDFFSATAPRFSNAFELCDFVVRKVKVVPPFCECMHRSDGAHKIPEYMAAPFVSLSIRRHLCVNNIHPIQFFP